MKKELYITKKDLEKILRIVEENDLGEDTFKLIQENDSGIGYTTDMEFDYVLNGRPATVSVEIATSDEW
jgi:hypothetical protein